MAAVAVEEHLTLLREYSTLKYLLDTHKQQNNYTRANSKMANGNPYSFVRSADKSFTKYSPRNYKISRLSTQTNASEKLLPNSLTLKLNTQNKGHSSRCQPLSSTASMTAPLAVAKSARETIPASTRLVVNERSSLIKQPQRSVLTKIHQPSANSCDSQKNKQSSKYKIRNITENIVKDTGSLTNVPSRKAQESSKYSWKANDSDSQKELGDSKISNLRLQSITPDKRLVRKGKYRLVKLKNSPKFMNRIKVSPKFKLKSKIFNRKLKSTYWNANKTDSRFNYHAVNGHSFSKSMKVKSPGKRWQLHSAQSTASNRTKFGQQKMIIVDGVQFILNGDRRRLRKGEQKLRKSLEGSELLLKSKTPKKSTQMQYFANRAVHRSIFRLNVAKQKSKKFCLFYNKFGKCNKKENGTCPYIHDSEKIAICKRFLKGSCHVENCLFAHTRCRTKMPACNFFILGSCHNGEACNYSHVNVGRDADVCLDFVNGYCPEGDKCKKWHLTRCIQFEQKGHCDREKCPLIHRKKITEHLSRLPLLKTNSTALESPDILSLNTGSKIQWEGSEKPLPAFIPISDITSTTSISGLDNSTLQIRPNFLTGKR